MKKEEYDSFIKPNRINSILLFLNVIILAFKLLIAYKFFNNDMDKDLFNIMLFYLLFYYSVITLSWSDKRLQSIHIIVSQFIDKFIENFAIFFADIFIVVVLYFARRQPELNTQSNVLKVFGILMLMRAFIQFWRITQMKKVNDNTGEYNKFIRNKKMADNVLATTAGLIIESNQRSKQ